MNLTSMYIKLSFLSLLLIVFHGISAATYTSAQNGAWNDGSTWVGGTAPPFVMWNTTDEVNIDHEVTHSGDLIIEGKYTLNINNGGAFKLTDGLTVRNEMKFNVNGTLETGTYFIWDGHNSLSNFTGDATINTGTNLTISNGQFSPGSLQATIGNDMNIIGLDIDIGTGLISIGNDHNVTGGNSVNIDADMDITRNFDISDGPATVYNGKITVGGDLIKEGGSSMSFYDDLVVNGKTDVRNGSGAGITDFYIGPNAYYTTSNYYSNGGFETDIDGEMDVRSGTIEMINGGLLEGDGDIGWNTFTATNSTMMCADGSSYGSGYADSEPSDNPIDLGTCGPGNFVLPVTFTNLTATQKPHAVTIDWGTAVEKNNDRFEVQKSNDGDTFMTIGAVKGAGNSAEPLQYSFDDYEKSASTVYYRIKQIDFDGEFSYSMIIHTTPATKQLAVFPNPAKRGAKLTLTEQTDGLAYFSFSTSQGDIIQEGHVTNNTVTLPQNMEPGIYLLNIKTANSYSTQRIVVQ